MYNIQACGRAMAGLTSLLLSISMAIQVLMGTFMMDDIGDYATCRAPGMAAGMTKKKWT